jgi:hypothetical protein
MSSPANIRVMDEDLSGGVLFYSNFDLLGEISDGNFIIIKTCAANPARWDDDDENPAHP